MRNRRRWWFAVVLGGLMGLGATRARGATGEMQPWLLLPWDDSVGRIDGDEADSEGPKSFALTPEGGVLVLDQVNLRVLDLDARGDLVRHIPLPAATFDEVADWRGEAVLLLDRLVARALLVVDRLGTPRLEVPLEGRGIPRSGLITALLPRSDGVWLEVGHRYSVKVLDEALRPCAREIVLGRPVARGLSLVGEKDGQGGVTLRRERRNARRTRDGVVLTGRDPFHRIVWVDEDAAGRVVLVVQETRFASASPFRVERDRYRLVVLDPRLEPLAEAASPWVLSLYDQRSEIRVGADGRIWQLAMTREGALLLQWDWRAP